MKTISCVVLAVVIAIFATGCSGVKPTLLPDGRMLIQYKDKDAIGPNQTGALLLPAPPAEKKPAEAIYAPRPHIITLEETYTMTADGWKQKCPSPKQRHSFYHDEKTETRTRQVLAPSQQIMADCNDCQPPEQPMHLGFGTGPGPVESIIPALATATGIAVGAALLRPSETNISGVGGAGGNSSSSAAAAAESTSSAWQNQGQWQRVRIR